MGASQGSEFRHMVLALPRERNAELPRELAARTAPAACDLVDGDRMGHARGRRENARI